MNKIKIILIAFSVIAIGGAFTAYKMYNKPHVNVEKTTADLTVISTRILEDFENDETTANTKYLSKIVQVTGKVSDLIVEDGNQSISLNGENSMGSVLCHLSKEESEKFQKLNKDEIITIKGICTGYLMDVILIKCVLIN